MRPGVVLAACIAVAGAVVAYALLAPSGLPTLRRLQAEERKLADDVAQKKAENARLVGDVQLLKGDTEASKLSLEKRAREELGYIAPDEVVLHVPDSRPPPPPPPVAPAQAAPGLVHDASPSSLPARGTP
jgi:cell division protein FtsB